MAYIKIKGRKLFDGYRFLTNSVLVMDDAHRVLDVIDKNNAGEDVLSVDGILTPGFINCHCHLELSHLKNIISEKTGLTQFVQQVVKNRNQEMEIVQAAMQAADAAMWHSGIMAVGDICNTTDSVSVKKESKIQYHNFIEAYSFYPENAQQDFQKYLSVYQAFKQYFENTSLVPHAPYSVNESLWKHITALPNNDLISIHNQESAAENEWFQMGSGAFKTMYENMKLPLDTIPVTGKSSIQSYLHHLLNKQVIAVHNVYTSAEDIGFAENNKANIFWCICANANKYITEMLPDIPRFIQLKQNLVLGTDSLASNWSLNIFDEIKTIEKSFDIPLEILLQAATSNGAKALKMDKLLGSFEKGKKPGVNLLSENGVQKLY